MVTPSPFIGNDSDLVSQPPKPAPWEVGSLKVYSIPSPPIVQPCWGHVMHRGLFLEWSALTVPPLGTLAHFANFAIRPFGPTAQPSPVEVNPTLLYFSWSNSFQVAPSSWET